MSMVRNRAMMPSVMSIATEIAVPWAAPATVISEDARERRRRGSRRDRRRRADRGPAPSVPPSTNTNSSRNTTGMPAMKNVSEG